jgi:hypothetical protein
MNQNNIYNYIKLCKKSNISDIKQIASDPDIISNPERVISKYNISLNEINGILEVKKFSHYLDCDDALEYIHEKYIANGGKGGRKGPKGPKTPKQNRQKANPNSKKSMKKKERREKRQQRKKEQAGMTKKQKKELNQKRKQERQKQKQEDSEEDEELERSSLSDAEKRNYKRERYARRNASSKSSSESDDSESFSSESSKSSISTKLRGLTDTVGSNRVIDNLIKQIQEMNKKMVSIEKVATQTNQMMNGAVESISEQADRIESALTDDGTEKAVQEGGKCKCSCEKKKSFDDYNFTSDEENVIEKCG